MLIFLLLLLDATNRQNVLETYIDIIYCFTDIRNINYLKSVRLIGSFWIYVLGLALNTNRNNARIAITDAEITFSAHFKETACQWSHRVVLQEYNIYIWNYTENRWCYKYQMWIRIIREIHCKNSLTLSYLCRNVAQIGIR